MSKVLRGGFPEPLSRPEVSRRVAWYQQYINSMIQKDMKDLGKLEHIDVVPRLVKLLSNQVGSLTNFTELANLLQIQRPTVSKYISLLQQLFLFDELPAWHSNHNKRLVKTPKVHIVDSGLLSSIKNINMERLNDTPRIFGQLLESYVYCELKRLASFYDEPLNFYH